MKRITAIFVAVCLWASIIGTPLAVVGVSTVVLSTTACSPAQVVQDVEGVLKEAAAITGAAGQTQWSAEFTTAADSLQAAYAIWDQSTTRTKGQKIQAALNALVAATAVILPNDPYAVLINEMVALADLALGFWPSSTVQARYNSHVNAVAPPTSYKDARKRWNELAIGNLAAARIK